MFPYIDIAYISFGGSVGFLVQHHPPIVLLYLNSLHFLL